MADTVEITATCPACGHDATWYGRQSTLGTGTGTTYDQIDCPPCDGTWSFAQQLARRLERLGARILERTAA